MKVGGKHVLVTGAGGFVGSHLVERLVRENCRVRCLIEYDSRGDVGWLEDLTPKATESIEVVAGDLRDADAVRGCTKGIEVVFHLGGLTAIPYSYQNPRQVVETNVIGTLNVVQAARAANVERVVHTSTSEVYGTARSVPIGEDHALRGQSPYSASKIGADKIAESFHNSFDLPVATIRPFNIYGPRQSARAVIPTIVSQALSGKKVKLGSLHPTRDFTYVTDTAEGFVKVAECDAAIGGVFNVGSNAEISIGDLVEKIAGLIGRDIEIERDDVRLRPEQSEVGRLWADNRLAAETFGWKPSVALDDGLGRTIEWIAANLDRYDIGAYTR